MPPKPKNIKIVSKIIEDIIYDSTLKILFLTYITS